MWFRSVHDRDELVRYLLRRVLRMAQPDTRTSQFANNICKVGRHRETAGRTNTPIGLVLDRRSFGRRISRVHHDWMIPRNRHRDTPVGSALALAASRRGDEDFGRRID